MPNDGVMFEYTLIAYEYLHIAENKEFRLFLVYKIMDLYNSHHRYVHMLIEQGG